MERPTGESAREQTHPSDPSRRPPEPEPRFDPVAARLLDQSPTAILFLENDRIVEINRAAALCFGQDRQQLLGRPLSALAAPGQSADWPDGGFDARIREAAQGVAPWTFPWRFVGADGGEVEGELSLSSVRRQGRVHTMAVLRDLSERRLLESRLRQSQRMELLGQLVGGIAHDFNNMLTAIEGHLDLALARAASQPELAADLGIARDCTDRASTLSRRLLAFSRERWSEPEPLHVNLVIDEVGQFLRGLIRADISLIIDSDVSVHSVSADVGQVEQALMNLALNAQDAMPQGGTLTLTTSNFTAGAAFVARHPWVRPGPYARIEVRDTGAGIAPEHLGRVFEPFFSTKTGSGTGLGLSIVYGIVKQHRGFIGVESEPGRGTLFWILLPACVGASAPEPCAERAPRNASTGRHGDYTVLVVEDEDVVRRLAVTALSRQGYRVVEAHSAEAATQVFQDERGRVDLLVTDMVLSGVSGRNLAEVLLSHKPELLVIYTSGYDAGMFPEHLAPPVGSALLQKPYSLRELAGRVRRTLLGRPPAGAGSRPA